MALRPHNKHRNVLPVLSEVINFKEVPKHILEHIKLRLNQRVYNMEHVHDMRVWAQETRRAPRKEWYKDFGSFYLCGYGSSLATVLDKEKFPVGHKISKKASFVDGILDGHSFDRKDAYDMDTYRDEFDDQFEDVEEGESNLDLPEENLKPEQGDEFFGQQNHGDADIFNKRQSPLDEHLGEGELFESPADWFGK